MKKELAIFVAIFLFLSIGMHFKEWVSHPIEHLRALPHAGAYGIGAIHPLIFTMIIYIMLISLRGVIRIFKR